MKKWLRIEGGRWTFADSFILGTGGGFGKYSISYSVNQEAGTFLNGKISAKIKIKNNNTVGAGLICRTDIYGTFLALHIATDDVSTSQVSLRLSVIRNYEFIPILSLKEKFILGEEYNSFEIEFISGQVTGTLRTSTRSYDISYCIPYVVMPGFAGLVKFYNTEIVVRDFKVEKYNFKKENDLIKMKKYKYDAFISHSSKDKEIINQIIATFNSNGITYWVDQEKITFGDTITNKIEEGLKESKYILVALSKNLGKSNWCRAEYGPILNREYSGNSNKKVIPLKLDDCSDEDIPLLLYDKKRADYNKDEDFKNLLNFLKM